MWRAQGLLVGRGEAVPVEWLACPVGGSGCWSVLVEEARAGGGAVDRGGRFDLGLVSLVVG